MRRTGAFAGLVAAVAVAAPAHALIAPVGDAAHLGAAAMDVRAGQRASVPSAVRRARRALLRDLGPQGFLSADPVTGAVRFLGRTDGYLSGPARGDARRVALRWARGHLDVLGLADGDLRSLRLARRFTDVNGVTRLIFRQTYRGIPAFDNGLRVNVARDGRIVNVGGSPRADLRVASVKPRLSLAAAVKAAGLTGRRSGALRLVSTGPRSARLAWRAEVEQSSSAVWDLLVDAGSGRLLRRANKVKFASGLAWDHYPGAPAGGAPRTVDYSRWLTAADALTGNNTHVYNDADNTEGCGVVCADPVDGPDIVTPNEEIRPQGLTGGDWLYAYSPVASPAGFCPAAGCAWNHLVNGSWLVNRDQDGTQVFFFVNTFHDHLEAPPISFTEAAGNFQFTNRSGQGKDGDGVFASNMDAAAQAGGRPIPTITSDNANMLTRPDGQPAQMQMYLFEPVQVGTLLDYPFSDVSGGSDASVVYHEYTHGLSNRLITDADGNGTLDGVQSGAMGEAWSDWYAMDFLMKQGFERDSDVPGELRMGAFVDGGQDLVRTEPVDCTLGAPIEACPRRRSALAAEGGGGYTYEHFGHVSNGPEVHADGEIWVQTLMDLRRRLVDDHGEAAGTERAEAMITRAMTLSPDNPSFVDMRNAILQADVVAGKKDHTRIWQVFAPRGMGASASAKDGGDAAPTAAFDLPPNLPNPDVLAPAVTIDDPAENGFVRAEAAVISGTAADDAGVTALTVNGATVRLDGATWTTTLKLGRGRHEITVSARDIEDHVTSVTRHVTGDVAKPRLRVRRAGGRILGRATDDTGIARVKVAGKRVKVGRRGAFRAKARRRAVKVVATDRAGRVAKRTLRVR
jgi:extracellular elastinolytic metalloproteinase